MGHVVFDVDGDGRRAGVALGVGDGDGEALGAVDGVGAVIGRWGGGVRSGQGVAEGAVRVDVQGAEGADLIRLRHDGDAGRQPQGAAARFVRAIRIAAGGQRCFVYADGAGEGRRGHFVDGDVQGGGRQVAIFVFDGVGEAVDAADVRLGDVVVGAVGVQGQGAQCGDDLCAYAGQYRGAGVAAGFDAADVGRRVFAVRTKGVVADYVAAERFAGVYRAAVGARLWNIVDDVYGKCALDRAFIFICNDNGKLVLLNLIG